MTIQEYVERGREAVEAIKDYDQAQTDKLVYEAAKIIYKNAEPHRKNRVAIQRRDADRTKVGKCVSHESRKAAIVFKIPVP